MSPTNIKFDWTDRAHPRAVVAEMNEYVVGFLERFEWAYGIKLEAVIRKPQGPSA